jgi:signal transduction histidine kinase
MVGMKSLLSKNLTQFLIYAVIIVLCSTPLFFFIMKYFYADDLDELIEYRRDDFIEDHLPTFTLSEIEHWNHFNEDMQILPVDEIYPLDQVVQEPFYNAAEGHPVDYRVLYTKIEIGNRSCILMSRIAMIETKDLIRTLVFQYGILFLVLIVSLTIIQRLISKKLWKPFYDSLFKIENFNLEQGIVPEFEKTDTIEFARLNENLNKLIKNDVNTYIQQKEFIENASHELQTPLAVFQSQLDLLLQDTDLTESQVKVVQSLYAVSSRLARLNKNLLLLAKIDNSQFKEIQEIDFNQVLNTQLFYLKDLAENNGINVSVEINNPLIVNANKTLLESLINNLVVNAIRHNTERGFISVRVKNNIFSVSNTGEKTPLDQDKIFGRFIHTSEEKKGNGLGLSIAYQICKLHGWKIEYHYRDSRHLFCVQFD